MKVAELILANFRGRQDYVAVGDPAGFHPEQIAEPLSAWRVDDEHLGGKVCLGFYLMTPESKVHCSCVDFDSKPEKPDPLWKSKTEQVYYFLANAGLSPLVEISQSGEAAHVWLFFDEATDAWIARAWWRAVSAQLGVSMPEVYPRQDQLTGKGLGNLVRYPLWNQSRFVDVESDWAVLDPKSSLESVNRSNATELKLLAFDLGFGELKPDAPLFDASESPTGLSPRIQARLSRPYTLLARRWNGDMDGLNDNSRSALVLSIACELVRVYVPTPEIEHALKHWCDQHGYQKGDRADWIPRTVAKAYEFVTTRTEKRSVEATTMDRACHAYLDKIAAKAPMYVRSGILEVDQSVDGAAFGEMVIVAARPANGKSAFALQWLDSAAKSGLPCLIVSEEMSAIELGKRALLSISEIEEQRWHEKATTIRSQVNDHYAERAPVYVQESTSSIDRCEEVIDQFCCIHGVRVVAVDYMQLLGGRGGSRYEDVTDISRRLKQAARRNDCVLMALSQLNRSIENREGRVPKMSDLRESGQIEQDADLILFLQWPAQFDPNAPADKYLIFAAKRRNGPIRTQMIETQFNPHRQHIGKPPVQAFNPDEWLGVESEIYDEA